MSPKAGGAKRPKAKQKRVVELFAGVGGFRLALETRGDWKVVWSNQWEPGKKKQHASDCYVRHFGRRGHICEDIAKVTQWSRGEGMKIPPHELLVGGFPCQDYSVATTNAKGIEGKKGVLWWEIHKVLNDRKPPYFLLENVDRLLKSPTKQRGRDFAIMLSSMATLGYAVEWRVINAADYGFPQKRRRVYMVGRRIKGATPRPTNPYDILTRTGVLARAFPAHPTRAIYPTLFEEDPPNMSLPKDLVKISRTFGEGSKPFRNAGLMFDRKVWTVDLVPDYTGERTLLRDVLQSDEAVPEEFYVPEQQLQIWRRLKGAKNEERSHNGSGITYHYSEGAIPFPDPTDRPSRTVVTGEGGRSPSRFKHIVLTQDGRYRRLTPVELERLNGFDDGWTDGMTDTWRAFCMGNALVVGIIQRIGKILNQDVDGKPG